jgi:hypothetical protein
MQVNWIFGDRTFRWTADEAQVRKMLALSSPGTIDRWTFADGGDPIIP